MLNLQSTESEETVCTCTSQIIIIKIIALCFYRNVGENIKLPSLCRLLHRHLYLILQLHPRAPWRDLPAFELCSVSEISANQLLAPSMVQNNSIALAITWGPKNFEVLTPIQSSLCNNVYLLICFAEHKMFQLRINIKFCFKLLKKVQVDFFKRVKKSISIIHSLLKCHRKKECWSRGELHKKIYCGGTCKQPLFYRFITDSVVLMLGP